jgi:hypothetical protein
MLLVMTAITEREKTARTKAAQPGVGIQGDRQATAET